MLMIWLRQQYNISIQMSKRTDVQSIISKIQNQMERKDLDRRFSKQVNRTNKPNKTYTTSFLNSQLRNKSFDSGKSDHFESFMNKKGKQDRRLSKDKQKLHESFSHLKQSNEQLRSRSLYFTQFANEEPKKEKNIKLSDYFQQCEQLIGRIPASKEEKEKSICQNILNQFDDFKIEDIGSLIQLIDTCVEEANSYISDLTLKIQKLAEESEQLRRVNRRLEEMNKTHIVVIKEKDDQINRLAKNKPQAKNQDLKNLLKIIDQLNEENNVLKKQIQVLRNGQSKIILKNGSSLDKKKEMYNQIHRKIDILNISISRQEDRVPSQIPHSIKQVNQEQYLPKDTAQLASSANKKYKYIKPKSMGSMAIQ